MFNVANTFSVLNGNSEYSLETKKINIFSFIKSDMRYAKYIVAGDGVKNFVFEAACDFINCDIVNGKLYAGYSATVEGEEFDGLTFSFFSLSPEGERLIGGAEITPLVKQSGKSITFNITVNLEVDGDSDAVLMGGDNPLIRFLLGNAGLNIGSCVCLEGECNHKNTYINYLPDFLKSVIPVEVSFFNEGINFCTVVPSTITEAIILIDTIPVLRCFLYEKRLTPYSVTVSINSDKTADLRHTVVDSIASCTYKSSVISGLTLTSTFNKLYKSNGLIQFRAGRRSVIKSDVFHKYAAILSGNELLLFKAENGVPTLIKRLDAKGVNGFDVITGGYVAAYGKTVIIYDFNNDNSTEYNLACGKQNLTVNEGGLFHYLREEGGVLQRFCLYPDRIVELEPKTFNGGFRMYRDFFSAVVLSKEEGCYYLNSAADSYAADPSLQDLYTSFGEAESIEVCDGAAFIKTKGGSDNVICTLSCGSAVYLDNEIMATVHSGIILTHGDGVPLAVYNRGKKQIDKVYSKIGSEDICSMCIIGDYVLALETDGAINTYICCKSGAYIYYPGFKEGDSAVCLIRVKENNFTQNGVRITFSIS